MGLALASVLVVAIVVVALQSANSAERNAEPELRSTVAQYIELEQSVLVPNVSGSRDWPAVTPSQALVEPARDGSGALVLSSALQASMVEAATKAIKSRQTPSAQSDNWWIKGAIAAESKNGFQVVGAGERIRTFHIDGLDSERASVTVQADEWQNQVYLGNDGNLLHHTITGRTIDTVSLVRGQSGAWLVDRFKLDFVPGHGP